MIAALLLLGAVPAQAAPPATYVVDRVTTTIADDERIGTRKMGMLCLPAGALRWRDLLPGHALDQREVVEQALDEAGLATTALPAGGGGRLVRIKGIVTAAGAQVCAKLGMLRDAGVVGDASLSVDWRVQAIDRPDRDVRWRSTVRRHLDRKTSLGGLYRTLLADAARDLAQRITRGPAAEATPTR